MTLKTIFKKPIDRPIEGVIKADDQASLRIEIEEYVLTNEVEKRLEYFLEAYNDYQGANGVWVSGFFGSGKSHLLKMLALLLENHSVEGVSVLESFLSKCGHNEILKGDLKKAVSIPSKSILFNIDQKADVISKTQIDALLAVFVKVFDEMCGYYGKHGHIAQFERDLDSRGQYQEFLTAYQDIAGIEWRVGREQALLESPNIAAAYAKVTGNEVEAAQGILDKYRSQYKVSIEDFAEQVYAYIQRQSPNFRLNFFVDEVGQYIANNVKLMTNLQTIAESLATKCRGRAWIIVTAQEDMDTVMGEKSYQQSNDFSKIQARFANRLKLTSADVAEVIQKRILMKNETAQTFLTTIYHQQSNNFKTLFDFADGAQTYRNFQDRDHFIQSYPFIPYQFALFQSAIQTLSIHNAFEGKHSSVGERSMLGVFQQVAIQICNYQIGQLATFDLMFEGIRSALKSSIQKAILQAERHLDNQFAVRLLKALFLVKYVKEFKPTPRNLSVLMLDEFNKDISKLKKQVEEGLNILEQQTYIQRHGDLYEYLTDEEKDIEQEIKNTEVETSIVSEELAKVIFDHTLKLKKIRDETNKQDYPFSKKMDDVLRGREYELTVHIITPFNEHAENEEILRMQSFGREELVVIIPPDERLIRDLIIYKQTEKFVKQNITITQKETVKAILTDKSSRNTQRHTELQQRVYTLLAKAKLVIQGSEIEVGGEDPQNRIVTGFQQLILKTYPNLRMLRGIPYTENETAGILNQSSGIFTDSLSEAEQEMLAHVQINKTGGMRTTLKTLIDKFERKPYGWYDAAILCIVASLCARGKLEVRCDGNLLDGENLRKTLTNSRQHSNIILEPQIDFTPSQVRNLREFYEDFFNESSPIGEAKVLARETAKAFEQLINELNKPLAVENNIVYPFVDTLKKAIDTLEQANKKPPAWYLSDLSLLEDEFLDLKEEIIDPIQTFMGGSQKQIFDNASNFIKQQEANFPYIEGEELKQVKQLLLDPQCFKGDRMKQVKSLLETLQGKIARQTEQEIKQAKTKIDNLKDRLFTMAEYKALSQQQQQEITKPFLEFPDKIETNKLIPVIRETSRNFEEREYNRLLARITSWTQPKPTSSPKEEPKTETKIEYISSRAINITFDKAYLGEPEDVELYLEALRKALLTEIHNGKRITI